MHLKNYKIGIVIFGSAHHHFLSKAGKHKGPSKYTTGNRQVLKIFENRGLFLKNIFRGVKFSLKARKKKLFLGGSKIF